jgi:hypothetical protein
MATWIDRLREDPDWRIRLCFAGGSVVWVLFLTLVYALTSVACYANWFGAAQGSGTGLKVVQALTTVLAALLVAGFGFLALGDWRAKQAPNRDGPLESRISRIPFAAYVTALTNALYLLIIVVSLVPILALRPCA